MTWVNINRWIAQKQSKNSNLKKIVIGSSYEKRDLFILSLSNRPENPAVILVGGEQGKDWMSPLVILNLMTSLLEQKHIILDYYNFFFLPVFNPDGYIYSMDKASLT